MTATPTALKLLQTAATAADEALAEDPVALDVSDQLVFAECFLIVSADNHRHARAIVESITTAVKDVEGRGPDAVEGEGESNWLIIDYGDVVVHVLLPEEREYYALEKLWDRSPHVELDAAANWRGVSAE